MNTILGWLVPLILGPLSKFLYDLMEKWIPFLEDKLPSWLKPIVVAALAFGVTTLAKMLSVVVPTDILQWQATDLTAILTALYAYIRHNSSKLNPPSVPTPAAPVA